MPANQDRLQWFTAAKFGLFVHWGPYSVAGVEASWPIMVPELAAVAFGQQRPISEAEYRSLPARFDPIDYDPHQCVQLAAQAGMKYVVFTAKHHDGFCMFDAPGTDYKITNTPYGQDICSGLAAGCAQAGLRLCFYYSPPDMHHPGYRDTTRPAVKNWLGEPRREGWANYLDTMEAHLRKLLTDYGHVSAIWFDGLSSHDKYDPPRFHRLIDQLSPDTLINDRLGPRYDYITPEQFIPRDGVLLRQERKPEWSDGAFRLMLSLLKVPGIKSLVGRAAQRYASGDLELVRIPQDPSPNPGDFQPWETCMTMNETWGYNPDGGAYKPTGDLIRNLVEVVSRGGNYLLNVGPTPRGTFPAEAVERLRTIGEWMAVNGQAIHSTTHGPLLGRDQQGQPAPLDWARTTAGGDTVYLHILDWPSGGEVHLDGFQAPAASVTLLAGDEELPFVSSGRRLMIQVPTRAPDSHVSVLAIRSLPQP